MFLSDEELLKEAYRQRPDDEIVQALAKRLEEYMDERDELVDEIKTLKGKQNES